MYSENYEDDINRCKDILCSWIGKINIVKIIILPKAVYRFKQSLSNYQGFPDGTVVKNPPTNAGDTRDMGLIPGLGRSHRVGNGNQLQYSCLKNSTDRGAWRTTSHGVANCRTQRVAEHKPNYRWHSSQSWNKKFLNLYFDGNTKDPNSQSNPDKEKTELKELNSLTS